MNYLALFGSLLLALTAQALVGQTTIYTESFETTAHGWQATGYADVWKRGQGSTPSTGTGPSAAFDGSSYFFAESSSPRYNQTAYLTSPAIALPAGGSPTVSFWYSMHGSSMGTLRLSAGPVGGPYSEIWSESGDLDDIWNDEIIDLSSYAGSTIQLRFTANIGTSYRSDMAIDDLVVEGSGGPGGGDDCDLVVSSFPYREGFETGSPNWTEPAGTVDLWRLRSGATGSGGTGPGSAKEGSFYQYCEASVPNYPGKEQTLEGPCFDFGAVGGATLTFYYHMYGNHMGELAVEAQPVDGGDWQRLWSRAGNLGNEWRRASVNLSALRGGRYRLRFWARTGNSYQGDAAIDDLEITAQPVAAPGDWGQIVSNFPYVQDFESGIQGWAQSGDKNIFRRQLGATPSGSTGPTGAHSGTYYVYTETSSPNFGFHQGVFTGPAFDLTGHERADFSFKYHAYGAEINRLELQASTDGGQRWQTIWTQAGEDADGPLVRDWHPAEVDLTPFVGGLVKLRFLTVTGSNYRGDLAIDNLRLDIPDDQTSVSGYVRYLPAGTAYDHDNEWAGETVEDVTIDIVRHDGGPTVSVETDFSGRFSAPLTAGLVDVEPRVIGADPRAGLGSDDVLLVQQHIMGTNYITDPIGRMAADVNRDGQIDVSDLNEIQAVSLGNAPGFANAPDWQLIADHYLRRSVKSFAPDPVFQADFWNPAVTDDANRAYPYLATLALPGRTLTYASPDDDWVGQLADWELNAGAAELCRPGADFLLFKTGDVNRSANPHTFGGAGGSPSLLGDGGTNKSVDAPGKATDQRRLIKQKRKYEVSVFATTERPIHGFQAALRYDPELIRVERISPNQHSLYSPRGREFNELIDADDPIVRTLWTATAERGRRFNRDHASRWDDPSQGLLLYRFTVNCYAEIEQAAAAITVATDDLPLAFNDEEGKPIENVDFEVFLTGKNGKRLELEGGKTKAGPTDESGEAITVFPNPAREVLNFELSGVAEQATQIRLVGSAGSIALVRSLDRTGSGPRSLFVTGLQPGAYYLEVLDNSGVLAVKRIVVVK